MHASLVRAGRGAIPLHAVGAAEAARFTKERMGFATPGRLFDQAFAEGQAKAKN